jgi:hypothetical protein
LILATEYLQYKSWSWRILATQILTVNVIEASRNTGTHSKFPIILTTQVPIRLKPLRQSCSAEILVTQNFVSLSFSADIPLLQNVEGAAAAGRHVAGGVVPPPAHRNTRGEHHHPKWRRPPSCCTGPAPETWILGTADCWRESAAVSERR